MILVVLALLPSLISNCLCISNLMLVLASLAIILGQRLHLLLGIAVSVAVYHFVISDYVAMVTSSYVIALISPWGIRLLYLSLYPLGIMFKGRPRRVFLALIEVLEMSYPLIAAAQNRARELSYGNKLDQTLASLKHLIRVHEANLHARGPDTFSQAIVKKKFMFELITTNLVGFAACTVFLLRTFKII